MPFAYGVGERTLRVVVRVPAHSIGGGRVAWNDRYAWEGGDYAPLVEAAPLGLYARDGDMEYWAAEIELHRPRFRYRFGLDGPAGLVWYGWDGLRDEPHPRGAFEYAYLAEGDRPEPPEWARGATFYQIFPDRFARGGGGTHSRPLAPWDAVPGRRTFLGGDLDGIVAKLDHLASLSVDALYLTPIFTSPSNHRYDTSDYFSVDPDLGGNPALRRLVSALHARGMRLLLDGVFNHSGADWPPFVDALQRGAASAYARWFSFDPAESGADSTAAAPPGGPGYETWSVNVPTLPKLRTSEPDLRDLICRIGRFWVQEFGIDGWRLDVANEVDHRLWRAFRQQVRSVAPEAFLVGEVWQAAMPWLRGDQFDSVMDYPLREAILGFAGTGSLDAPGLLDAVDRLRATYPEPDHHFLYNLLGSHDVKRALTACGNDRAAFTVATALLYGLPGIASIYYGDEVGMEGGDDPHNRAGMVWGERQDARLLDIHVRLGRLRRTRSALRSGTYERLDGDGTAAAFLRGSGTDCVAVMANPRATAVRFPIGGMRDRLGSAARLLDTFSYGQEPATLGEDAVHLPPTSVAYLTNKEHS